MTNHIDEGSLNEGSWAWKQADNNNRLIAFQHDTAPAGDRNGPIELAYFGASCFRITTPAGLSILIDPWRNPPSGAGDWFLRDFPRVEVDICLSTHAHFDHDAVHRVSAGMSVERPVGTIAFADALITGIADKHVSDSSHCLVDWAENTRRHTPIGTRPPDNWRSFDNSLVLIETAGLRILHWGDNRPDPPDRVWSMLGSVDIALLPIDGSQHILSYAQAEGIARRLEARLIVPCHYAVADVTAPDSTLLSPDAWLSGRADVIWTGSDRVRLNAADVARHRGRTLCFGDHVAFATSG